MSTTVEAPERAARAAGLSYVSDSQPGIKRIRAGNAFRYLSTSKHPIRRPAILNRIRSLAIPPAWRDVWICPSPRGHLQATGRDARGRKQYRYHPRWAAVRDEDKYDRVIAFGKALPRLRKQVARDLKRRGLAREKVMAAVVRLLETTLIRVGNDEYARDNDSFGLTTMLDRHARIKGRTVRFSFQGKSGLRHVINLNDSRLARVIRECQELPGQELFQYVDEDDAVHDVTSSDVNEYLRQAAGSEFTAKDFRTWAGTVLAAHALQEFEAFDSKTQAKRNILRAIEKVAQRLGNTKTVCRKCYIHPAILDAYLDGSLVRTVRQRVERELKQSLSRLEPAEAVVLAFLQKRLGNGSAARRNVKSKK